MRNFTSKIVTSLSEKKYKNFFSFFKLLLLLAAFQLFHVSTAFSAAAPPRLIRSAPGRFARPQAKQPVLFIQAGMVYPINSRPIKDGVVIIKGTRIAAVGGPELEPPEGAKILRFPGKNLLPGFIDAAGTVLTLKSEFNKTRGSDPGLLAADGLDPFSLDWKNCVQEGVTTAYISFGPRGTIPGRGAIIRLNGTIFSKELCLKQKAQVESAIWPNASSFVEASKGSGLSFLFSGRETGAGKAGGSIQQYKNHEPDIDYEEPRPITDAEERASLDTELDARQGVQNQNLQGNPHQNLQGNPHQNKKTVDQKGPVIILGHRVFGSSSSSRESTFDLIDGYSALRENLRAAENYKRKLNWYQQDLGAWERAVAKIKQEIEEARKQNKILKKAFPAKPSKISPDPLGEALLPILKGSERLRIWADSAEEIKLVLKLASEFKIKVTIVGGIEAYLLAREISARGASVILVPLAAAPYIRADLRPSQQNAVKLFKAEVQLGFGTGVSGKTGSRLLRHFVSQAVSHGLNREYALRAITLTNAELLGVSDILGSLSQGKEAQITLFDGPPLSTKSRVVMTLIGNKIVYQRGEKNGKKK